MQQGIKALAIEREQMAQIKQRAQIFPFFDRDVQNQTAQKIARRGREMRARPGFVNDRASATKAASSTARSEAGAIIATGFLNRLRTWDFDHGILAHGEIIETGAKPASERAWRFAEVAM